MAAKSTVPVKYYEIVDKKSSGFIMDGTENTQFQQELVAPSMQWISSTGMTAVQVQGEDGKMTKHFKPIRYINRCDIIDEVEQDKRGFRVNRFEDKIGMENGFATVAREGTTIGLFDYFEKSFYNADNPDRPQNIAPRYREVKLDQKATQLLDEDELLTQSKSLVYALRLNTGKAGQYKYNTDRIDAICRLVNVWDESPERKLILLLQRAMQNPKQFLETVVKAEQTVITEVSHSIELGVLNFDKNVAQFSEGDKIIFNVTGDKLKPEQKIEQLAAWLSTDAGNSALTELRAKLETAKEKQLA